MKLFLNKILVWIKDKCLIDKLFVFKGTTKEFIEAFNRISNQDWRENKFYTTKLKLNRFKITDAFSIGIMIINNIPVRGITVIGEIISENDKNVVINLKSRLRFEIYFFLFLVLFFYIMMIKSSQHLPFWVYPLPFIPIPWFIWIYKIQTTGLINKIAQVFKLKILNNCLYGKIGHIDHPRSFS